MPCLRCFVSRTYPIQLSACGCGRGTFANAAQRLWMCMGRALRTNVAGCWTAVVVVVVVFVVVAAVVVNVVVEMVPLFRPLRVCLTGDPKRTRLQVGCDVPTLEAGPLSATTRFACSLMLRISSSRHCEVEV